MWNPNLAPDYMRRAIARLPVLDLLYDAGYWPDVVVESQKVVELALKSLLRACGIAPPQVHDVSRVLEVERKRLPAALADDLPRLGAASRRLRRDLELAVEGANDLTPSEFYRREDAEEARATARFVVERVAPQVLDG